MTCNLLQERHLGKTSTRRSIGRQQEKVAGEEPVHASFRAGEDGRTCWSVLAAWKGKH